ncbi:M20 family metallopeptidase [Acidimangrovimonas sediminis]|uniref:M20 family metallopeptidase n=1 Tax=Acidimangrovimonas sediminis TaxID=2056283 RepID=UPI000C800242|nr:M20 family metallopeptidase [Acidimangrovimonas sediminis]
MQNTDRIWDIVEGHGPDFTALSDKVFDTPEIAYTEYASADAHAAQLEASGFRLTRGLAGIPTAMMGEAGEEGPVIAILGEYDALPELGQEAGVVEPSPAGGKVGPGHGCGHNLFGAASMLAAVALRDYLAESGIKARVRYYGCPAEEGGAAKTFMVRAGCFDDVDAAITWHPSSLNGVDDAISLANSRIDYTFTGRSAHAAAAPELGRSGLDAVELMNIGVNYMREHMPDSARVHYAYLDAGGVAPNVVQAKATVRQLVRASDLATLQDLIARVDKIAQGAALMTETQVTRKVVSGVSNLLENRVLSETMQAAFDRLGAPEFDAEDRAFAEKIRATLTPGHIAASFKKMGAAPRMDLPLADFVAPLVRPHVGGEGSTDVGDVSWAVPTVQARVSTCAVGTPLHTWQMTAQGKSPMAHKGMIHAAKVMASTAQALIEKPELLKAAKEAHATYLSANPYTCPMPDEVQPPLQPRKVAAE